MLRLMYKNNANYVGWFQNLELKLRMKNCVIGYLTGNYELNGLADSISLKCFGALLCVIMTQTTQDNIGVAFTYER